MRFILASMSPRRKELLSQIGIEFEVIPAQGEEILTTTVPKDAVMELASQKAEEVFLRVSEKAEPNSPIVILGADTVVSFLDEIMGKPKDEEEAFSMLSKLSGNVHSVYTGVSIIYYKDNKKQMHTFYQETKVWMYPAEERDILRYIKTKEPMDKAGAYGIQGKGAVLVEKIEGDYNNVVGLPAAKLNQQLKKLGIEIFPDS